jgi:hypothetical protein
MTASHCVEALWNRAVTSRRIDPGSGGVETWGVNGEVGLGVCDGELAAPIPGVSAAP